MGDGAGAGAETAPYAIVLICVYGALLLWTAVLFMWLVSLETSTFSWRSRHSFLLLIALLCCVRIPNFVLMLVDGVSNEKWYFWMMFNLSALLYLTVFTELILFWSRMHDSMRPALMDAPASRRLTDSQRKIVRFIVMGGAWVVYAGVFVLFFFLDFVSFTTVVSWVTSSFYAIAAVFFAVYGTLLYRRVREMPLRSAAVTSRIRRVLAVAIIMTIAFLARAILNGLLPSLMHWVLVSQGSQWMMYSGVFISIEVFPLFLVTVLIVMPRAPKERDAVQDAVDSHYRTLTEPESPRLLN